MRDARVRPLLRADSGSDQESASRAPHGGYPYQNESVIRVNGASCGEWLAWRLGILLNAANERVRPSRALHITTQPRAKT